MKDNKKKDLQVKDFKPNRYQWDYLNTAVRLLTDSPTIVQNESGVSRQSWYRWVRDPAFNQWFYNEYRIARQRIIPKLDEIAMKYAGRGEYDFWKAMNQKTGELPLDGQKADVQVQVNNVLQEQRDKYDI